MVLAFYVQLRYLFRQIIIAIFIRLAFIAGIYGMDFKSWSP